MSYFMFALETRPKRLGKILCYCRTQQLNNQLHLTKLDSLSEIFFEKQETGCIFYIFALYLHFLLLLLFYNVYVCALILLRISLQMRFRIFLGLSWLNKRLMLQ